MAASMHNIDLIEEPAYCTLKMNSSVDVEDNLQRGQEDLLKLLDLRLLHEKLLQESQLIRNVICVRHAQMRHHKSMQLLKRIKACLQRICHMNRLFTLGGDLLKDIKNFLQGEDHVYIPCKQSWIYMLYLISQYYELLQRTVSYTISTFQYLTCASTTMHLLNIIAIHMGLTARIWQLCRTLSNKLAGVYNKLYAVQLSLKGAMSQWKFPVLPSELLIVNEVPDFKQIMNRTTDEDLGESSVQILGTEESRSLSSETSNFMQPSAAGVLDDDEDLGVPVDVKDYPQSLKRKLESDKTEHSPKHKRKKMDENTIIKKKKKKNSFNLLSEKDRNKLTEVKTKKGKKKKTVKSSEKDIVVKENNSTKFIHSVEGNEGNYIKEKGKINCVKNLHDDLSKLEDNVILNKKKKKLAKQMDNVPDKMKGSNCSPKIKKKSALDNSSKSFSPKSLKEAKTVCEINNNTKETSSKATDIEAGSTGTSVCNKKRKKKKQQRKKDKGRGQIKNLNTEVMVKNKTLKKKKRKSFKMS